MKKTMIASLENMDDLRIPKDWTYYIAYDNKGQKPNRIIVAPDINTATDAIATIDNCDPDYVSICETSVFFVCPDDFYPTEE